MFCFSNSMSAPGTAARGLFLYKKYNYEKLTSKLFIFRGIMLETDLGQMVAGPNLFTRV